MPPSLVITPPAAAGGGSPISNPEVAYVRTDGNDGTAELGNPAKPYLTATAAFAALKASHASTAHQHSLHLGVGDFELSMTTAEVAAGYQLFLNGDGGSVDTVDMAGSTLNIIATGYTGGEGVAGESVPVLLIIRSNLSVRVTAQLTGGEGGAGAPGDPGGTGGTGGDLSGNIYAWATNLDVTTSGAGGGGAGGETGGDPGGSGSNTLTVHGNFCVFNGAANYGAVEGCYVDGVFEYV